MSESRYLRFVPQAYRRDGEGVQPEFIGRLLKAFERVLDGPIAGETDPTNIRGVQELIDQAPLFFDPERTPPEFLDWLASWLALELPQSADWMEADFGETTRTEPQRTPVDPRDTRNRRFIRDAARLYRIRGTRQGLEELLNVYVGDVTNESVRVRELSAPFQIGVTSTIGVDSMIGERKHYFQVEVDIPAPTAVELEAAKRSIRALLDREKPAHTYYDLIINTPTLQVGVSSTVGTDTLVGGTIVEGGGPTPDF